MSFKPSVITDVVNPIKAFLEECHSKLAEQYIGGQDEFLELVSILLKNKGWLPSDASNFMSINATMSATATSPYYAVYMAGAGTRSDIKEMVINKLTMDSSVQLGLPVSSFYEHMILRNQFDSMGMATGKVELALKLKFGMEMLFEIEGRDLVFAAQSVIVMSKSPSKGVYAYSPKKIRPGAGAPPSTSEGSASVIDGGSP